MNCKNDIMIQHFLLARTNTLDVNCSLYQKKTSIKRENEWKRQENDYTRSRKSKLKIYTEIHWENENFFFIHFKNNTRETFSSLRTHRSSASSSLTHEIRRHTASLEFWYHISLLSLHVLRFNFFFWFNDRAAMISAREGELAAQSSVRLFLAFIHLINLI